MCGSRRHKGIGRGCARESWLIGRAGIWQALRAPVLDMTSRAYVAASSEELSFKSGRFVITLLR